jgi:tRNA-splicing ligase RtcB (3'-phosphate/5'-hydroxy nucleic acid ligase)
MLTDQRIDPGSLKARVSEKAANQYIIDPEVTGGVPVRVFLTPRLLQALEDSIWGQVANAISFPGVRMVAIMPDTHHGYGVPVGCAILTDRASGAVAMGPVGYDIGCGMVAAASNVPADVATEERRLKFNRAVSRRVALGAGESSKGELRRIERRDFERLVREGAGRYIEAFGARVDRTRSERNFIPVRDSWSVPWGGPGRPERGVTQLGTLGGGNHFIELQRNERSGILAVQIHTGSRGFGHGLATNYFHLARKEKPEVIRHLDMGFFTPESRHYQAYLDAVAAGANFAIVNRLVILEAVAQAFREVFDAKLELVYEISHNLVQAETHPEFGDVWTHRKGATRAFPAGHPALAGTRWAKTGHPVLIPGSNRDHSFILRPLPGAEVSGFSVNHGAGRRMSRHRARRSLVQAEVDRDYRRAGIVVNNDGRVPIDESGACYKPAREVIDAVVGAGLAVVEETLWPLASVKGA